MSDAALVARTLSGDRKAFTRLLRRHEGSVYRVCYRILGDREDAKDATQEAFIRAYERLESFEGRSAFRTWLLRVAVNVSLNMSKKNRRESARELPPERLLGADPEPGTLLGDFEFSEETLRARREYTRRFQRLVEEGMAAGVVRRTDPRMLTFAILGLCNSVGAWYRSDGRLTDEEIIDIFAVFAACGWCAGGSGEGSGEGAG